MDLIEEDLLGRPRDGLPRLDLPLQGAELAVLKPARESALKILEKGFGLEPGIAFQQVFEFGPNLLERILPGLPGSRGKRFTRQAISLSVHSSGLGIHTCPQGCKIEWLTFAEELAKPANLGDFDHGGSLLGQRGNRIVNKRARGGGKSSCRWQGNLVVVDHKLCHAKFLVRFDSSLFATCRATLVHAADCVMPCPATKRAAVLLIETDSISVIGPTLPVSSCDGIATHCVNWLNDLALAVESQRLGDAL